MSKFWDDSGSRASILMVRQFSVREAVVWDWIIDILGGGGVGFGEVDVGARLVLGSGSRN
jgi:hypothetical protein